MALPEPVTVKRVMVAIGDRVRPGQSLIELDDENARQSVAQLNFEAERAHERVLQLRQSVARLDDSVERLTAALATANAELVLAQRDAEAVPMRQWKDSPERASAAYDQAQLHQQRLEALFAQGVVARQDVDDARIATRIAADDLDNARRAARASARVAGVQAVQAKAQADSAVADVQRQRSDRVAELQQAQLHQREADAALAAASERLQHLSVTAPHAALVAEVSVTPGDRLLAGATLLRLARIDPMVVEVDVPPSIVNAVTRGDSAVVVIAGSDRARDGHIATVAPLPGDGGAHTLEIEFDNPAGELLTGQTARVRFPLH